MLAIIVVLMLAVHQIPAPTMTNPHKIQIPVTQIRSRIFLRRILFRLHLKLTEFLLDFNGNYLLKLNCIQEPFFVLYK